MPRILVDYDGVIYDPDTGKDVPEAGVTLRMLHFQGWEIVVYTSHPAEYEETIEKFMHDNNIPYDSIITGKPRADIYIDDRAATCWEQVRLTIETWKEIGRI